MNFNQITYFLRVCDTLNFTRAAEICIVSQPSLSAAIQRLEKELGGDLFDRSEKTIHLTPFGESMRVHLKRIEEAKVAANVAASEMLEGKPFVINMGLMCTLNPNKLLSAFAAYRRASHDVELLVHDIWESRALDLLASGAVDCALIAATQDLPDKFESIYLADDPIVLAMSREHRFADRTDMSIKELKGERYVDRLRCEFREQFFKTLDDIDIQLQVALRSEREDLVVAAILNDVGVAIMPESATRNTGLAICRISDMPIARTISIVTIRDRALDPRVQSFIEILQREHNT